MGDIQEAHAGNDPRTWVMCPGPVGRLPDRGVNRAVDESSNNLPLISSLRSADETRGVRWSMGLRTPGGGSPCGAWERAGKSSRLAVAARWGDSEGP